MGLRDEKDAILSLEARVQSVLDQLEDSPDLEEERLSEIGKAVNELLKSRRDYVDELISGYRTLAGFQLEANRSELRLMTEADEFRTYIEERVLWIRSSSPISFEAVKGELTALSSLMIPDNWLGAGNRFVDTVIQIPSRTLLWLAVLAAVTVPSRWVRKRIKDLGIGYDGGESVMILSTLKAFALTLLLAAPIPVILWGIGMHLKGFEAEGSFNKALGQAFTVTAMVMFTFDFYRGVCRPQGLAQAHFFWPEGNVKIIRRNTWWFMPTILPLLFLVTFAAELQREGLEARLTFLAGMMAMSIYFHRILHPETGLQPTRGDHEKRTRWRSARHMMAFVAPLGLAVASLVGFHYTAEQLAWRLINSIWVILVILLAAAVLFRWFYLERRKMAKEELERKREEAKEKGESEEIPGPTNLVNLDEVKAQTQSLIQMFLLVGLIGGLWGVWVDILPALNVLDKVPVWHVEVSPEILTDEESVGGLMGDVLNPDVATADVASKTPAGKVLKPITVADLGLAALILSLMVMISRNLQGFLELTLLRYLKVPSGGGYAITTLCKYGVTVIGIIGAFGAIGISWEKVQWLAAAVSLGIGFGLQEIFANFVLGLILLFERPIRIGDFVTVGNVTGKVSKIKIRATTITDWDRKEFIVPNREFVTGQLLNWTLTDNINRFVVSVGLAYGGDVEKALATMKRVANEHPLLLKDPAPLVSFEGFGDNSLNLVMRCYLPNLDNRIVVITEIHSRINEEFKKAGLEIAFPQRDLHIRSFPKELLQGNKPEESTDSK